MTTRQTATIHIREERSNIKHKPKKLPVGPLYCQSVADGESAQRVGTYDLTPCFDDKCSEIWAAWLAARTLRYNTGCID